MLLIANMVQIAAYTRRTEVGIMRLVGATRWYTQLPFLLEAMVAALIGVVLAIVGLILVRALFLEKRARASSTKRTSSPGSTTRTSCTTRAVDAVGLGLAMAGVTAYVTLRLYVRR